MPNLTNTYEIVLLHLRCASVINSVLEFNKLWDIRFREHHDEVSTLIKAGHSCYIDLVRYLTELRKICIKSRFTLDNIKMELLIAREKRSFDNINIFELRESSRRLKTGFESLYQNIKVIQKEVFIFSDNLKKERKKIKNESCSIGYNGTLLNSVCAAVTLGSAIADSNPALYCNYDNNLEISLSLSAGGISAATIVTSLIMKDTKQQKLEKLDRVLQELEARIPALIKSIDEFGTKLNDPMQYILHQIELAENNITYHNHDDPVRVVFQAGLMLQNTIDLGTIFKEIQEKAKEHADRLRTAIRLENPRSLINL